MIDNFSLIASYIDPIPVGHFYEVCLYKKVEGSDQNFKPSNIIRVYPINSKQDLLDLAPEMIALTRVCNAEIYINLSLKCYETYIKFMIYRLSMRLLSGLYSDVHREFLASNLTGVSNPQSVFVPYSSEGDTGKINIVKWWIEDEFKEYNLFKSDSEDGKKIIGLIPVHKGTIILTDTFSVKEFHKEFPDIDVFVNNMILLYAE